MDKLKNLYNFMNGWWKLAKEYIPLDMNPEENQKEFIDKTTDLYNKFKTDDNDLNLLKREMACCLMDYVLLEPIKKALDYKKEGRDGNNQSRESADTEKA